MFRVRCSRRLRGVGRRHYGTIITPTERKPGYEARLQDSRAQAAQRVWSGAPLREVPLPARRPPAQFHVPSVIVPAHVASSSPHEHKIHVLGHDERSRFIAHALSSIYDSVQVVPTIYDGKDARVSQYTNLMNMRGRPDKGHTIEENTGLNYEDEKENSRIDRLIVTGYGSDAVPMLTSVKHRIDKNTSICLATNGLGVLEDVREKVFTDDKKAPRFLLGHMSHRLAFNERWNAIKLLKEGEMHLTAVDFEKTAMFPYSHREDIEQMLFINRLRTSSFLNVKSDPFDSWLMFKLPSILFESVVDPVCELMGLPYNEVFSHFRARTLMRHLLEEILMVVAQMPETANSPVVKEFVESGRFSWFLRRAAESKGIMVPELVKRLRKGVPTDGRYHNSYFVKRAMKLGLNVPKNTLMAELIKTREEQAQKALDKFVPVLETSVPNVYDKEIAPRNPRPPPRWAKSRKSLTHSKSGDVKDDSNLSRYHSSAARTSKHNNVQYRKYE